MFYSAETAFLSAHRDHIAGAMLLNKGHLDYIEWMVGCKLLNPVEYCDVLLRISTLPHLNESWVEDLIVRAQVLSVIDLIYKTLFMEASVDKRREMLQRILLTCPHDPGNQPIPLSAKLYMWYVNNHT